jgi:S1-C subfamily serine protease
MLRKTLSGVLAIAALVAASQSAAQAAPEPGGLVPGTIERESALEESRVRALTAAESANVQRELSRAREELARTVADVARIQAQVREPALRDLQRKWRYVAAGQPALGLNIEDSDFGVFVRGVTPNGPAANAGVEVGDTIVAIDDVELARGGGSPSAALLGQIGNVMPGDDVKLRILRGGDYREVVVEAGDNRLKAPLVTVVGAPGEFFTRPFGAFRYSGAWSDIELVALTPALGEYFGTGEGLLVVRAGRAAELGFRDGDVIIDLAGRKPQSPEHALRILASFEPGESLQAAIMRQKRRESLAIRVPAPSE